MFRPKNRSYKWLKLRLVSAEISDLVTYLDLDLDRDRNNNLNWAKN